MEKFSRYCDQERNRLISDPNQVMPAYESAIEACNTFALPCQIVWGLDEEPLLANTVNYIAIVDLIRKVFPVVGALESIVGRHITKEEQLLVKGKIGPIVAKHKDVISLAYSYFARMNATVSQRISEKWPQLQETFDLVNQTAEEKSTEIEKLTKKLESLGAADVTISSEVEGVTQAQLMEKCSAIAKEMFEVLSDREVKDLIETKVREAIKRNEKNKLLLARNTRYVWSRRCKEDAVFYVLLIAIPVIYALYLSYKDSSQ